MPSASVRAQDARRMSVHTSGTGLRDLFVSYISEVPVWKSTYRLVIPQGDGRPFLQGWAIVDNTLGEDWDDVKLSLVAGAPQSFVQPLSQPIFTRRPVVPLSTSALFTPQTHDATLTEGKAEHRRRHSRHRRWCPARRPGVGRDGRASGLGRHRLQRPLCVPRSALGRVSSCTQCCRASVRSRNPWS